MMFKQISRIGGIVVVASLIVMLIGCGGAKKTEKNIIAMVPPAMTSTFYIGTSDGAREAARELALELKIPSPKSESDFLAQVNIVETLISQKVKALAVCAINNEAICASVEKANAAKIPFCVFNSLVPLPSDKIHVDSYIGYDQQEAGRLCGKEVLSRLKEKYSDIKGKIIILQGLPGFHTTERTKGFMDAIDTIVNKNLVVQMYPAKWRRDEAKAVVERLLTADKNIDAIFGCSDAMAQGAAQAAIEAKVDLITIGIDGNPDMIEDIKNGVTTATLSVFPKEIGRFTIQTIDKILKDEKVEKFVKTPIMIVSKENMEEYLEKL